MKTTTADVLVIGSGAAGLYAAIRAAEPGLRVILWEKGLAGRSGGTVSGAGPAAYGSWSDPRDSADTFFRDTVACGSYLSDQPLVRIFAEEAQCRIRELEQWGVRFDRDHEGTYSTYTAGGHSYPRIMSISDRVGLQMAKVLRARLQACRNVLISEDTLLTRIVTTSNRVSGALGVDFGNGETVCVNTPAIVLATGGIGQLYSVTSNAIQLTGDGIAAAYEAGARLINMEQVQFFPCAMVHPPSLKGFILGIQENAKLYNNNDERFMTQYEPERAELTTRDRLARSIHGEISAGRGTPHGGVWLDATGLPSDIYKNFRHEIEISARRGYDYRRQRIEVAPSAHFFMGGIEIGADGNTSIPGLFAAGECSAGLHGGNRLSGNALTELLIFGSRAGKAAAQYAGTTTITPCKSNGEAEADRIVAILGRPASDMTPALGKSRLRSIMDKHMGVIRSGESLQEGEKKLAALHQLLPSIHVQGNALQFNQSLMSYLELEKMVTIARTMIKSALIRKESRGAHYREDYRQWDLSKPPQCTLTFMQEDKAVIKTRAAKLTEITPQQSLKRGSHETNL
jgi:succinate dehydrogenase/fumarate reductase flavoprotein subunit